MFQVNYLLSLNPQSYGVTAKPVTFTFWSLCALSVVVSLWLKAAAASQLLRPHRTHFPTLSVRRTLRGSAGVAARGLSVLGSLLHLASSLICPGITLTGPQAQNKKTIPVKEGDLTADTKNSSRFFELGYLARAGILEVGKRYVCPSTFR